MFSFPFPRFRRKPTIEGLYGMIVAQARSPVFYKDYGVPDTVDGRFDMLVLHLILVLRHLRQGQPEVRGSVPAVGQQIFDHFCRDMDDNFREMGVGDLKVPKEMQRVAEAFYGRANAYEAALAAEDEVALAAAVARNVFGNEPAAGAERLAAYMTEATRQLAQQGAAPAALRFPDPATVKDRGVPSDV